MKNLRIGVSAAFSHADPHRPIFKGKTLLYMEQSSANWLMSEGALPIMLPPGANEAIKDEFVASVAGLILQGGSDVSPRSYGEEPLQPEWSGDWIRDGYEQDLVRRFVAARKPILGICRGAQLLNVAFGGTLYQDIPTQLPEAMRHRDWEIYDRLYHDITPEPGSWLAQILGDKPLRVNSVHHQAIKGLGRGLVVEARSADGVIEAVRGNGNSYIFGVQWHPEFLDGKDPAFTHSRTLLRAFLDECGRPAGVGRF